MPSSPDDQDPVTRPGKRDGSAVDASIAEAQARYHRDRLALYRARVLSAKPASAARLRDLQRASAAADARLRHAERPDATAAKDSDQHGPL